MFCLTYQDWELVIINVLIIISIEFLKYLLNNYNEQKVINSSTMKSYNVSGTHNVSGTNINNNSKTYNNGSTYGSGTGRKINKNHFITSSLSHPYFNSSKAQDGNSLKKSQLSTINDIVKKLVNDLTGDVTEITNLPNEVLMDQTNDDNNSDTDIGSKRKRTETKNETSSKIAKHLHSTLVSQRLHYEGDEGDE